MKVTNIQWQRQGRELGRSTAGVARSFWLRLRGLLGRPALAPGDGLLIEPCNAIHTAFMGYNIDVVFVSPAHKILALAADVAPWRMRTCFSARYVVELAAGDIDRLQLTVGDICQLH
ncbi:MAG TPA: DUF192 domain-containing protein [Cellvibrionaceae bacterium]